MDTRPDPPPQPEPPLDPAMDPVERARLVAELNAMLQEGLDGLEREGPVDFVQAIRDISRELGLDEPDLSAFGEDGDQASP